MRIAILCHTSAGGSGILATELALGLSQQGHEIHVIGERPPFRIKNGETENIYRDLGEAPPIQSFWGQVVDIVRKSFMGRFRARPSDQVTGQLHFHELISFEYPLFDESSFPTLRAANTLAKLIEEYKIDVVNAHYVIPHATSALLARDSGLNVKVITTLHGTDVTRVGPDPAFLYTTRHAINSSNAVTAVCEFLKDEAKKAFNLTREISVIPNWVDSGRFKPIMDPKVRAKYAQPDERICIHVSNFRTVKRSQKAVSIFADILEQHPSRLILIGDGPEKQSCIDLAVTLGVSGRVLSLGNMAAIEDIMGIADVLILPSEIEAFPLVALEAMASGAICLASNVGGLSELITDGETGFLFPVDSFEDMSRTALELFENAGRAKQIRFNARKHVVENYSPEKLISKYRSIYEELYSANND